MINNNYHHLCRTKYSSDTLAIFSYQSKYGIVFLGMFHDFDTHDA